ncbi:MULTISPECIES: rhamnose ABC transporter substrate-binding protein [unclassified Streptomyces]|uniref:rhamnose ABC transporter substrate-binding protein n=1 Tax=unclassified Streptomyces TaxID=2593676 RepID=UPI0004C10983|nr:MULTISPECIES: rhamnose ABC transporter substrate-binding protein [unclassified Streptomyces]
MRSPNARRTRVALAAVASLSAALTACGGNEDDGASGARSADPDATVKTGLTVAFLPKQRDNNLYFTNADLGAKSAVEELGSAYEDFGSSSATDIAGQNSYIKMLAQQEVDALAVSAQDPAKLCTELKSAMKQGVVVVTYDSDTDPECRDAFISQASAEDLGRTEVRLMAEQIDNQGEIAILSASRTAENQNSWIDYMKDELHKPAYKDIELVEIAYGDDDPDKSVQEAQRLLQKYPGLKGIISPTTIGIEAAARVVSGSATYKGKVKVTGLGTPNEMRKYVGDGTVEAFELWDPAKLGELTARTAVALASGQITGDKGESFKAGGMGEYTIGEDGVINLGKPQVFDKNNIDQFDF